MAGMTWRSGWHCGVLSVVVLVALFLRVPAANATTWYVDGKNGQATNVGTLASPFLKPEQAMAVVKPGDTVYLLPTAIYGGLAITASGAPGEPIIISGAGVAPSLTAIRGTGLNSAIWVAADYIVVNGFDVSAPGQYFGIQVSSNHHHVKIQNNVAHDCGAAGIYAFSADYIQVIHNVVFNNANNTANSQYNSGISLYAFLDVDSNTGTKNVIDGNIVYNNTNVPDCSTASCLAKAQDSDGNGIILDTFLRDKFDNIPYKGRTVIMNNVVFGNGGRGIWVYATNHVTVTGNTVYSNNQDPYEGAWHPGEIGLLRAGDVTVANNIVYTDGKNGPSLGSGQINPHFAFNIAKCQNHQGPLNLIRNIMFNPQNDSTLALFTRLNTDTIINSSNLWVDPKLAVLSLDPTLADFRPLAGSPALNNGDPTRAATSDIGGVLRSGNTTIGAYETTLN